MQEHNRDSTPCLTETRRPGTLRDVSSNIMPAMRSSRFLTLFLPPLCLGLSWAVPVQAADNDGSVILRMCKDADRVKTLSVMCHSYLNGYIDAAHHYSRGKLAFCLTPSDKKAAPGVLVEWIGAHPEALHQPAGAVLQRALSERFPCKNRP